MTGVPRIAYGAQSSVKSTSVFPLWREEIAFDTNHSADFSPFPMKESDIDPIGRSKGSDVNLCPEHPGYTDKEYRRKRVSLSEATLNYTMGQPIVKVDYSREESNLWSSVYATARKYHTSLGCREFKESVSLLEREGLFSPHFVPQLEDLNQFLQAQADWRIKPVNGIIDQREFLNILAFRTFCSTQYLRHPTRPDFTPEPDFLHEALGHIHYFTNKDIADVSQKLGIVSLTASDELIKVLAAIFWFTFEFGLCKEGGSIKFYGAGPGASFGEAENIMKILKNSPEHIRRLDLKKVLVSLDYKDNDFQPFYYCAESFDDFVKQTDAFCDQLLDSCPVRFMYDQQFNRYIFDRV
jgi:phenylalanine-4-hydroxylase